MNKKTIDIDSSANAIIKKLLQQYLPNTEIWAYGSRVNGTAKTYSDLDLVAFARAEQSTAIFELKEAFEESNLPFRVDLFRWDEIPEQFQHNIKKNKVLIGSVGGSSVDSSHYIKIPEEKKLKTSNDKE